MQHTWATVPHQHAIVISETKVRQPWSVYKQLKNVPLENKQTKNYDTEKINTWTFNIDLGLKKCLFALTWLTLENLPMWQFFFLQNIDKIVTQQPTHDFVHSHFLLNIIFFHQKYE